MNQIFLETRVFRLSDIEEFMTLAFFVLIQYRSVTDKQTDRETDIPPLAIPAVCIARYANVLVKSNNNPHNIVREDIKQYGVININGWVMQKNRCWGKEQDDE